MSKIHKILSCLLFMLGLIIVLLPVYAFCEMSKITDCQLEEITGQFATFEIVNRNPKIIDNLASADEYYSYTAAVIKLDMRVEVMLDLRALMVGYYDGDWDIDVQNAALGTDNNSPLILDGIRLEIAFQDQAVADANKNDSAFDYNHMASADRKFIFFKIATDHMWGNLQGDFNRISVDIDTNIPLLGDINNHREGLGTVLHDLELNDTDFYLAISQTGFDACPPNVEYTPQSIPGNGIWLHFSNGSGSLL